MGEITLLNNNNLVCPLCGSDKIVQERKKILVYKCLDCSFVFIKKDVLKEFYKKDKIKNKSIKKNNLYMQNLTGYMKKTSGRILTIGLDNINTDNFEIYNINSNDNLIEKLDLLISSKNYFDSCIMLNIIEKESEFLKILSKIHSLVKVDTGTLSLVLPFYSNIRNISLDNVIYNKQVNYFNRETLQHALHKTGFREIVIQKQKNEFQVFASTKNISVLPKFSIIVPVYNEGKTFTTLMQKLIDKKFNNIDVEFIIVESNSTDNTREEVLKFKNNPNVKIVLEDKPRGKGFAVRNGLSHASGDFVAIQDGDLEYDINDYDELIPPIINYRASFVMGSRHMLGWKMRQFDKAPFKAFVMNFGQIFFTALLNLFCASSLNDPFTMYKIFRKDCLYGLKLTANRFDFDWEIVIKLLRKGYKPLEIPINYKSRSFSEGKKIRFFKDPVLWMIALIKYRFGKLYYDEK
jgi:hypothetical protein